MRDQAENLRQMILKSREQASHLKDFYKSPIIKQHRSSKAQVFAVTSGKGGVGKTNFTVNLALALTNLGKRVLVIDADLGMANVDVLFGCETKYSLLHLLQEEIKLEDILTEGPRGIKYMSGGSGIYDLANLDEVKLQGIINKITLCDKLADVILVDTGAGINRNVLNFVLAADEVILVTTPEPTAMTDAYAMMKAYVSHHGTAPLKLVINRVMEAGEGQTVVNKLSQTALRFLQLRVDSLGFVYEDMNLVKAVKRQQPLLLAYPNTISAQCIEKIANQLLNRQFVAKNSGIEGFLSRFLNFI
ncbi:MAG: P-loop NTPase [Pelosinus sp.]|nr:P-loop NTPase [Pelosinus sp.]